MKTKNNPFCEYNAAKFDIGEPILVTLNRVTIYVFESYKAQQERENSITVLKLMALSESDKAEGKLCSKDQLLTNLHSQEC